MKKRVLLILLVVAMIMSVVPMTSFAAGTSSDGLVAADSIKANVNSQKFTHKEWTGNRYADLSGKNVNGEDVFGIAREESSVPRIPYASVKDASAYAWEYKVREDSPYFKLLTGEEEVWTLNVVQNQDLAKEYYEGANTFMQANYVENPADGWKEIRLPMTWPSQGFDFSLYSNITMPFQTKYDPNVQFPNAPTVYNPVGMYRKFFTVDNNFLNAGRRVYISFQGVESAYYVYINGKEVGYSEDTYAPHRFDITDYLNVGENILAVKVHKFCDGTWFEDQDMINDGGILRDVYLTSEPVVKIEDYHYTTDLDANYQNAVLTVSADVRNLSSKDHEGWTIDVKAVDENGKDLLNNATIPVNNVASTQTTTVTANFNVTAPKLWTDEKPNLYCLVLVLKDGNGKEVEVLSTQLGFREINFTSTQVDNTGKNTTNNWMQPTINGKRLFIRGANRHDTDPIYGKATRPETIDMDLQILKQNNFNAVRTSHYSNDEYFYWAANKTGIYVMAETNLECHAIQSNSGRIAYFKELMMDRTETTFMRLRSNPCIFAWSLGNEMAYTADANFAEGVFVDMVKYFKSNDPTRMVHHEGFNNENYTFGCDMYSDMYRSPNESDNRGGAGKLPYIQCEYAHAKGNSVGDLDGWYQAWLRNPNAMGGFIWDLVDQARALPLTETVVIKDKTGVEGAAVDTNATVKTNAGTGSLNGGYSATTGVNFQNAKYNQYLSGTGKSFTLEVVTKPTSKAANQVFLSKGDNQLALKTQPNGGGLEFFVYNGGWNSVNVAYPANWENNWHQIVGVYDKGNMKVYIDGVLAGEEVKADGVAASNVPVGVGYDNSNGRTQAGEISIARIYTKALTADEIKAQNSANPAIKANDNSVLLWVDYADGLTKGTVGWDYYSEDFAHVTDYYAEDLKGKFLAYGGDWGDAPNNGNDMENGLISADRTLQSDMYNAKGVYKLIEFSAVDINKKQFSVKNYMYWTNLNEYDVEWRVYDNGILYKTGTVGAIDLAPQATKTVTIPFEMPAAKDGHEYFVDLVVKQKAGHVAWAEAGYEQHHQQFQVLASIDQVAQKINKNVTVSNTATAYEISGDKFSFSISKADGRIKNYVYDGDLLIQDGPAASFWRCRTENDRTNAFDGNWMNKDQTIRVDSITAATNENGLPVITSVIKFPNAGNTTETIRYTINGNGEITVDVSVDGNGSGLGNFIRVGTTSVIPAGFEEVSWYGLGPWDTFADKKDYATQAVWHNTVGGIFFPFERIDDCGTMLDTAWIALKNEDVDTALLVASKSRIEVSAMHFTAYDMEAAQHPYELTPRDETILALNYGSLGIGTASLGRGPIESTYLPSNRVYNWNFTFIPVPANYTDVQLGEAAMPYHEAAAVLNIDDQSKNNLDTLAPDTATIVDVNGERNMKGYFQVQDDAKVLNNALSGKKEWTIEVVATPSYSADYNILAAMADNAVAMRTRDNNIECHIYAGAGWRDCQYTLTAAEQADFFGKEHQIAFSYIPTDVNDFDGDGNVTEGIMQLHIDGVLKAQVGTTTDQGVNKLDYAFGIGYDQQTNRVNSHYGFAQVRVYNKALTAGQLADQYAGNYVYTADNNAVELWIDFTKENDTVVEPEPEISYDVDADGDVDVYDMVTIKEWILSGKAPTADQLDRADFNDDGNLTVVDIMLLRGYILKVL